MVCWWTRIFWIITPSGQILRFGETTLVVLTGQWSSSVYHRYTITDLYDYKLPLFSKGYAEIWKDDWISEYGVKE